MKVVETPSFGELPQVDHRVFLVPGLGLGGRRGGKGGLLLFVFRGGGEACRGVLRWWGVGGGWLVGCSALCGCVGGLLFVVVVFGEWGGGVVV